MWKEAAKPGTAWRKKTWDRHLTQQLRHLLELYRDTFLPNVNSTYLSTVVDSLLVALWARGCSIQVSGICFWWLKHEHIWECVLCSRRAGSLVSTQSLVWCLRRALITVGAWHRVQEGNQQRPTSLGSFQSCFLFPFQKFIFIQAFTSPFVRFI